MSDNGGRYLIGSERHTGRAKKCRGDRAVLRLMDMLIEDKKSFKVEYRLTEELKSSKFDKPTWGYGCDMYWLINWGSALDEICSKCSDIGIDPHLTQDAGGHYISGYCSCKVGQERVRTEQCPGCGEPYWNCICAGKIK